MNIARILIDQCKFGNSVGVQMIAVGGEKNWDFLHILWFNPEDTCSYIFLFGL